MTWISWRMRRSSSSRPAASMTSRSDSLPMTIPTSTGSNSMPTSSASTSVLVFSTAHSLRGAALPRRLIFGRAIDLRPVGPVGAGRGRSRRPRPARRARRCRGATACRRRRCARARRRRARARRRSALPRALTASTRPPEVTMSCAVGGRGGVVDGDVGHRGRLGQPADHVALRARRRVAARGHDDRHASLGLPAQSRPCRARPGRSPGRLRAGRCRGAAGWPGSRGRRSGS